MVLEESVSFYLNESSVKIPLRIQSLPCISLKKAFIDIPTPKQDRRTVLVFLNQCVTQSPKRQLTVRTNILTG